MIAVIGWAVAAVWFALLAVEAAVFAGMEHGGRAGLRDAGFMRICERKPHFARTLTWIARALVLLAGVAVWRLAVAVR